MEQETKYWEQVLAVKEQGWSICRLPREKHTLGVRYGFAEAAPEFRDRGLAALRRGGDGNMILDQGIIASHPKAVRIRIKEKDVIVGTSSLPSISADVDGQIEDLILRARNNIFEEELFHEINREARTLASQGVRSIDNIIHLPWLDDRQILIDVVPLEYNPAQPGAFTGAESDLAESIALSLRILQSYAHRQNLRRRSQLPPPLTERKPPRAIYAILRPILTYLQHQSALASMRSFLSTLMRPLLAAGLKSDFFSITLPTLNLSTLTEANAKSSKATVEVLIEDLVRPLESSTTVTLSASTKLQIKVRTHLYPPVLGTEYNVTTTASPSGIDVSIPSNMHFTSKFDLEDHILHLATLDTVNTISTFPMNNAVDSAELDGELWLATDPHCGELTKSFSSLGRSKRMAISIDRNKLEIKWGWLNGKPEEGRCIWDVGDGDGVKSLGEVVAEAGRYEVKK
ncbi:MAG: RNA polymerase II mediator complex subunit [Pleopsidium flavum]|nr:MAG: RNA polymerase II mediator complex subunit [Pleopsidium flavum]